MSTSTQNADFGVDTETRVFHVEGMTCSACSARVEKVLSQVPGVAAAHVNLALERATLTVAPSVEGNALSGPVAAAGYRRVPGLPTNNRMTLPSRRLRIDYLR